jgi:hypothetical protein
VTGAVGQPRVRNFRVRVHGRIRRDPDAPWMPLRAEQHNFMEPMARLFYLTSSSRGIPVQGYHRYAGADARMTIKAAALVPIVDMFGAEMHQSETVTMFNDMCLFAPGSLVDPRIRWTEVDDRTVRATFVSAGHTIGAELLFNESGELVDFHSADRYQASADSTSARLMPWGTPVRAYRQFGAVRLASEGEGRWYEPEREYAYIELRIDDVQYNVTGE